MGMINKQRGASKQPLDYQHLDVWLPSCDDETHGDKLLPGSWEIGDASTMASPNPNVLLKGGRSPACCEVVGLRDK